ncbi:MAG TPA: GyrI-like domain-containing protein [Thermoplasmata archaeon]|nr:GyrI-like domain-containing protein [Thermoplasmata archaeon]
MAKAKVKVEQRKPVKLAYIEHTGAYDDIPFETYIGRLYGWAKKAHVRPGFYPLGVFYDSPGETPPEKCRSEIGIPISGEAPPEGGVRIREIPAMNVAALSFKGQPSEYRNAYRELSAWVSEHGYEWAGPSIEAYTKKPERVRGKTVMYAKIMAPVRRK